MATLNAEEILAPLRATVKEQVRMRLLTIYLNANDQSMVFIYFLFLG